ncbi:MAG: aminotransferase class I/II-fold pyridoxal phosphate-dependent enzyme [Muribaculaceae bacterium]|nr:aminotransferase class I/II-fold pyridoxal phosphate-dependent enzyme [Muribaculaceae bacterium]
MSFSKTLESLEETGNLRHLPSSIDEGILDFSTNDYLGIAADKELAIKFIESIDDYRFSSSASRLLASHQNDYENLETLLAKEYGRPVLLFNSGYHANTGILPALTSDSKCLIVADKLVHASVLDGIILSRAEFRRFPHNDITSLRKIIESNSTHFDRIIVAVESIYSMDGDYAPLEKLLELKKEFPNIFLYLDEAHSFGVKGQHGLGMAQDSTFPTEWDMIVCPLGKAAASMGAFVVCKPEVKDFLVNKCRSLIFSTALPPLQIKWTLFAISHLFKMDQKRSHLENLNLKLTDILKSNFPNQNVTPSHIQPLIIGESRATQDLSNRLHKLGIKAMPIRKPTVPSGTERIRFSLSAAMKMSDLNKLNEAFEIINAKRIHY